MDRQRKKMILIIASISILLIISIIGILIYKNSVKEKKGDTEKSETEKTFENLKSGEKETPVMKSSKETTQVEKNMGSKRKLNPLNKVLPSKYTQKPGQNIPPEHKVSLEEVPSGTEQTPPGGKIPTKTEKTPPGGNIIPTKTEKTPPGGNIIPTKTEKTPPGGIIPTETEKTQPGGIIPTETKPKVPVVKAEPGQTPVAKPHYVPKEVNTRDMLINMQGKVDEILKKLPAQKDEPTSSHSGWED